MSIRLITLLLAFISNFYIALSQDSCMQTTVKRITGTVERSLPLSINHYSTNKSGYYLIDIKLNDSSGSLIDISYYTKKHYLNTCRIDSVIKKIRNEWIKVNCRIRRILIPVFFLFEGNNEDHNNDYSDYPIPMQDGNVKGVYLLKSIIIPVSSRIK